MFQPRSVGGNVGAPPHVGEIERHEAVVDKIVQTNRTAVACVQDGVGNAIAGAEGPAVGLDHRPVAGGIDAESHSQHGSRRGIGPRRARHGLHRCSLPGHVLVRRLRHLAGPFGGHGSLLARIAVEQGIARPSPRHPGQPPGQADRIQNSGVEAERPHRRDQMRGIAHEEHAVAAPLRRHAMMNAVDDGVEDLHLVDGTDEANDLRAEFGARGLGDSGGERIKETPAVWLAHQDHPFLGIGEIGEVGIVARIGDVEIDLDVDQQAADVG